MVVSQFLYGRRLLSEDFHEFFLAVFTFLLLLTVVIAFIARPTSARQASYPAHFFAFRQRFLAAWFVCAAADWLQGAYTYDLFKKTHGVNPSPLFVIGYASSIFLGPVSGLLGDSLGRKRCCLAYCFSYIVTCLLAHIRSYPGLVVGRLCQAFSTEILYSSFESYLVTTFQKQSLPPSSLDNIFAWMYFGNFILAIGAGVFAQSLAGLREISFDIAGLPGIVFGGMTAPFDAAIFCCVAGAALVALWENDLAESSVATAPRHVSPTAVETSQGSRPSSFKEIRFSFCEALVQTNVLLCGLVVLGVESSLFLFVFHWTDALTAGGTFNSHGYAFSSFMMCSMTGSAVFGRLSHWKVEHIVLFAAVGAAIGWLVVFVAVNSHRLIGVPLSFAALCLLEFAFGMYFPAIGLVKSTAVPNDVRSSIYTAYRAPINALVCIMVSLNNITYASIVAVAITTIAAASVLRLSRLPQQADERVELCSELGSL